MDEDMKAYLTELAERAAAEADKNPDEIKTRLKEKFDNRVARLKKDYEKAVSEVETNIERAKAVGEKLVKVYEGISGEVENVDLGKVLKRLNRYFRLPAEQVVELYVDYETDKKSGELDYWQRWNKMDLNAAAMLEKAGAEVDFEITPPVKPMLEKMEEADEHGDQSADMEEEVEDEPLDDE